MQADTVLPAAERRGYKNAIDALIRMAREEGVGGFFSGAAPTIYRGLSINVGMLASHGPYKSMLSSVLGLDKDCEIGQKKSSSSSFLLFPYIFFLAATTCRFAAGALSGWTAATVSLPFDFLKTRLQVFFCGLSVFFIFCLISNPFQKQKPDAKGVMPYKNFLDCAKVVASEEGVMSFYRGYGTYCIRITPHIMLTWVFIGGSHLYFVEIEI